MANPRTPSYRRQAGSPHDRAFVEVGGRRIYLGRWNSPESIELYHRTIAEWLSNGQTSNDDRAQITVTEVAAAFWLHAQDHYRHPDGSLIKGSIEGYCRTRECSEFSPTCHVTPHPLARYSNDSLVVRPRYL